MISYFNYEINHNLEKLKKLNLINKKKINKKYVLTNNEKVNSVNNLPNNKMHIKLASDKTTEKVSNIDEYITHNIIIDNFDVKNCKPPTSFLGSDIVDHNANYQYDKNVLSKKLSNKVIHVVYQYKYKNKSVTGFGDLLRSIYFMLQFSEKYKLNFEIEINKHNIKKYLKHFSCKNNINNPIENNIYFYDKGNCNYAVNNNIIDYEYVDIDEDLLNYINNLEHYNNHLYFYLISHPNKNAITETHKNYVKNMITPTEELSICVDKFLRNLYLEKNNFITIHIRYYDEPVTTINNQFTKKMDSIIKQIIDIANQTKIDILILTSQNVVKNYIIKYIPNVKTHFNPICHTSKSNSSQLTLVNTLTDFFVMSYSKFIYSFSVYEHGSGFSKWCAITYNIPYICYSIQ